MTGMQSRPSGNESTLSTTDEKTKCMFPSMACPFSLVGTTQPNTTGVTKGQGRGISSGFYMYMYKHDPSYFLSCSLQILTDFFAGTFTLNVMFVLWNIPQSFGDM